MKNEVILSTKIVNSIERVLNGWLVTYDLSNIHDRHFLNTDEVIETIKNSDKSLSLSNAYWLKVQQDASRK